MCLTIKKGQRFLIAKTDIVCYKVVLSENKKLQTFFRYMTINLGNTYYSKLSRSKYSKYKFKISEALHSFVNYTETLLFWKHHSRFSFPDLNIIKCIIPKGSKYIKGKFNGAEGYASDCLTYLEIVK